MTRSGLSIAPGLFLLREVDDQGGTNVSGLVAEHFAAHRPEFRIVNDKYVVSNVRGDEHADLSKVRICCPISKTASLANGLPYVDQQFTRLTNHVDSGVHHCILTVGTTPGQEPPAGGPPAPHDPPRRSSLAIESVAD